VAKDCIIYIPEVGADLAYWAMSNGEGALLSAPVQGNFAEAAKAVDGRKSIVVVPGDAVLLAEAKLPGNSARAQQAIPYALEDQVADDVEDLHFAIGRKDKGDNYPVAIINRDTMDTLREQFAEVGLRPTEMVPEILALPKLDPGSEGPVWSALVDNDKTVVRLNGYRGFATDSETADIMLSGAGQEYEEEFSRGILLYHTDTNIRQPDVVDLDVETQQCESRLDLYASGLSKSPRINLLQGEYSYRQQLNMAWRPWRWSMVLCAALLAIAVGSKAIDYRRLGNEENTLRQQITQVWTDTFPQVKARRPVAQMKSRLRQLGTGAPTGGFTIDLDVIAAAFKTQPQSTINSIGYRPGRFDLDVTTDALPTLDLLKQEIEKAGTLTMKVQSARRQKDNVRSTLRLESK